MNNASLFFFLPPSKYFAVIQKRIDGSVNYFNRFLAHFHCLCRRVACRYLRNMTKVWPQNVPCIIPRFSCLSIRKSDFISQNISLKYLSISRWLSERGLTFFLTHWKRKETISHQSLLWVYFRESFSRTCIDIFVNQKSDLREF